MFDHAGHFIQGVSDSHPSSVAMTMAVTVSVTPLVSPAFLPESQLLFGVIAGAAVGPEGLLAQLLQVQHQRHLGEDQAWPEPHLNVGQQRKKGA